ncbi:Uncharacterized protein APZ42_013855 [Daphnia magna]|uniref:Peptidase A2 domain-containing protein n=1 Tax=Daphnia magna TaxID=35525 RepID=A0A162QGY6_9CRUS|nr:Uncharacterized protein APZ42_013855 [Daphnia magna]
MISRIISISFPVCNYFLRLPEVHLRVSTWLENFESIVDGSGWSGEKIVQMLRAKLTERAFSIIHAILKDLPHDYDSVKEALLDHFYGDENVYLYLKKFYKAKRTPGENIVDYALRLQEIFRSAYPVGHSEKSFAIILMQKFVEGLDPKLQAKVKYNEFKDFGELVTLTRTYASRQEALETDRERQEFIRSIDGTHGTNSAELTELKQMIVDQKEMMIKAVANVRHEDKSVGEKKTKCKQIRDVLRKPVEINCNFGSVDEEPPLKSRQVGKLTTITNESTSRIPLKIFQVPFQALFDTGASKSIIHERLFKKLSPRVTLPVGYGKTILQEEFIVTNGVSEDCILGWDAIQKHGFQLDGETKSIYLARDGQGPSSIFRVTEMTVTAVKKTTLPRQTSLVTVGQLKGSFPYVPPNSAFIFTPSENLPDGIYIKEFIGKVSGDGAYNIIVENHSSQQVIGKVALNTSEVKPIESREPIVISEVNPKFQAPPSQLLNDFLDLFASKDSKLGNTNLIKHTIDTEGRGPIRQRPYRVTNNQRKLLEDKAQEMLDAKVIRYSQSPWASLVVLAEKKNGEVRFCVDYRKLNSITKKDSFPMPCIDETLDKLYGKKFFTTLDLTSVYWQSS